MLPPTVAEGPAKRMVLQLGGQCFQDTNAVAQGRPAGFRDIALHPCPPRTAQLRMRLLHQTASNVISACWLCVAGASHPAGALRQHEVYARDGQLPEGGRPLRHRVPAPLHRHPPEGLPPDVGARPAISGCSAPLCTLRLRPLARTHARPRLTINDCCVSGFSDALALAVIGLRGLRSSTSNDCRMFCRSADTRPRFFDSDPHPLLQTV